MAPKSSLALPQITHYATRAAAHFESCESVSRDNLGHLLTVAFCLTAVSHAWPPCPTDMQSLHLTKHATNPQRPWQVLHSPTRRVWYFLSDLFCVCMRVREKTDCIPVTVCGLHVQRTTWHPATRHSTHRVASRTQSCGMSLVECTLHLSHLFKTFLTAAVFDVTRGNIE